MHKMLFDGEKFYQPQAPGKINANTLDHLYYDGKVPYIIDEFGGIKCAEANPSKENAWGYGDAAITKEDFYKRLDFFKAYMRSKNINYSRIEKKKLFLRNRSVYHLGTMGVEYKKNEEIKKTETKEK